MTPQTPTVVLNNIRIEMARNGVSRPALAEAVDLSLANLNRRLQGTAALTVPEMVRIADHLGVHPTWLMTAR